MLPDWSVYGGKITVKLRKIGKRNTQKKKGYETEKNLNMESDQPEIKVIAPPPPTTENIMKTLNNDKEPDENKTVTETETLSLVSDFGKDAKENGNEGEVNGQDPKPEENKINDDDDEVQQDTLEFNRTVNEVMEPVDTLEMRSRTVNEIFSPVDDHGLDTKNETEKKDAGDPKPKENKKNMEASVTREAERYKRESNVSDPITDVMEIRDQGGGGGGGGDRKGR